MLLLEINLKKPAKNSVLVAIILINGTDVNISSFVYWHLGVNAMFFVSNLKSYILLNMLYKIYLLN